MITTTGVGNCIETLRQLKGERVRGVMKRHLNGIDEDECIVVVFESGYALCWSLVTGAYWLMDKADVLREIDVVKAEFERRKFELEQLEEVTA